MVSIKRAVEVDDRTIFNAFGEGFSDYIIKFDMEFDIFMNRFFGAEGNTRELSYVTLMDDKPVAVLLAGEKTNEDIKTLRCGGMAVSPRARKQGIAKKLLDSHADDARRLGCRQVFLEVLKGNDGAIKVYEKLGYDKAYDLRYKLIETKNIIDRPTSGGIEVCEYTYDDLVDIRQRYDGHMPWQSDFPYIKEIDCKYYGIEDDGRLVAGIATSSTNVFYIWVDKPYRFKGYALTMLKHVAKNHEMETIKFTFANNSHIQTFIKHLGGVDQGVAQFEMYKWV